MDAVTKAFHELILQANWAHKAYNTSGPAVARNALYDLRAMALLLHEHLGAMKTEQDK